MKRPRRDYEVSTYIRTAIFKERAERYWKKHPRKCRANPAHRRSIQLHHLQYPSSRFKWGTEPDHWFVPLCAGCHWKVTQLHRHPRWTIPAATRYVIRQERIKRLFRWLWHEIKVDHVKIPVAFATGWISAHVVATAF